MKKVFLVDDDMDLVEQNKLVLTKKGFSVTKAHSAEEALAVLKKEKPDVIVLDVMMEHPTAGLNLASQIARLSLGVPVILLTGDKMKSNWIGQDGATWDSIVKYLDKPFDPNALVEVINGVLKK